MIVEELKRQEEELMNEIQSLDNEQMAYKILINSLYGCMANKYFRGFDIRLASSITDSGRRCITYIGEFVNNTLKDILKCEGVENPKDLLIYIATDSNYYTLDQFVDLYYKDGRPDDYQEVAKFLDKFYTKVMEPIIEQSIINLGEEFNASDTHEENKYFYMEREVIGDFGFWEKKLAYCIRVWDKDGFLYDKPKLKKTGMRMIKKNIPIMVKEEMSGIMDLIMDNQRDEVSKKNMEFKKVFQDSNVLDIAEIKPANGITKYTDMYHNGKFGPHTPAHVRASIRYNELIRKFHLEDKYDLINDGDMIKYINLKMPNLAKLKYIAVPLNGSVPTEFKLDKLYDYGTMFERLFTNNIKSLTEILDWEFGSRKKLTNLFKDFI